MGRYSFVRWINENVKDYAYIWSGVITPEPNEGNWGRLIAPDKETTFLIFSDDSDQTRYLLEFGGSDNSIHVKTHMSGLDAYRSRRK